MPKKQLYTLYYWWKYALIGIMIVVLGLAWSQSKESIVRAAGKIISSQTEWKDGYFNGISAENLDGAMGLEGDISLSAQSWRPTEVNLTNGSALVSDGTYAYILANSDNYFARYLPAENRWQERKRAPHMALAGSDMVRLGNYIYAEFGNEQNYFARYSILKNEWEDLERAPDFFYGGGSLTTDGTYIYALRGGGAATVWKYNPNPTGEQTYWSALDDSPYSFTTGASLVHWNGQLYTPRGGTNRNFLTYTISSDTWTTLPQLPHNFTETGNIDVREGVIYMVQGLGNTGFYSYNIGTSTWDTSSVSMPIASRYVGVVYNPGDDLIYSFRGNASNEWYKFDPDLGNFLGPKDLPVASGLGSELVYLNDYVYYSRGVGTTSFYRYSLTSGQWENLTGPGLVFNNGSAGVGVSTATSAVAYYLRGAGVRSFYKYDPAAGWTQMVDAPLNVTYGAEVVYPGSGNFLYATAGGQTRYLMKFDMSVGTTGLWSTLPAMPDDAEAGYGSSLVALEDSLYHLGGNGISRMMRFDIGTTTWAVESEVLPFAPYYGTDMVATDGRIIVQAGNYKNEIWEYDMVGKKWLLLGKLQEWGNTAIGPYQGGVLEADGQGRLFSLPGSSASTKWIRLDLGLGRYKSSGSWQSNAIDLEYVTGWQPLGVEATIPEGSGLTWTTRSSSDGDNWEEWRLTDGLNITSSVGRFLEIGLTMTSSQDGEASPYLSKLTVNFTSDSEAPSNPSNIYGWSQENSGEALVSGRTYKYAHPFFTWSGAGDEGQGVAGYYVYFGVGETEDPAVSGNFTSQANYKVNFAMDHTNYFLRLKTMDLEGNTSPAIEAFRYGYDGVNVEKISIGGTQFEAGEKDNVEVNDEGLSLKHRDGFWQQQRLKLMSFTPSGGSRMAYNSQIGKLYINSGGAGGFLYEYDIASDTWLKSKAIATTTGLDLVEGPYKASGKYLFAFKGGATGFHKYDIATSGWSAVSNLTTGAGASLIYDGNKYIYALKGGNTDDFYRYDIDNDNWSQLSANVDFGSATNLHSTNAVNDGGDMAYDGMDKLFAIQGGNRTGFSFYSIEDKVWTLLPDLPMVAGAGANIEYDEDGRAIYFLTGGGWQYFFKYDIDSQTWTQLSHVPGTVSGGSSMRRAGDYLYIIRGGTNVMLKYNLRKESWMVPTMGIYGGWFRYSDSRPFGIGADVVRGEGNNFYISRGNYDSLLVKYNADTGEINRIKDVPGGQYTGGELAYDSLNKKLYAVINSYYKKLYKFDETENLWTVAAGETLPGDTLAGMTMLDDGEGNFYSFGVGANRNFYKYSTSGLWQTLPQIPSAVGAGADMVMRDGFIYAVAGGGSTGFYRYGPVAGTAVWSGAPTVATLPAGATIGQDGFLVNGPEGNLLACRGAGTNVCYQYNIEAKTWSQIEEDPPGNIYQGGGAAVSADGKRMITVMGAGATNTYTNGIYSYVFASETSAYEENGEYVSEVFDLGQVYKYADLVLYKDGANNNSSQVYTRSRAEEGSWSDWVVANNEKVIGGEYHYWIASPLAKYIQVKIVMQSGDGIESDVIEGYDIGYYRDDTDPQNPGNLTVKGGVGSSAVVGNNSWNKFNRPLFDWPGVGESQAADDGTYGSGVVGYYVYFGVGETADPVELGVYTTASQVEGVGMTSGNSYFFRMKTVDDAGNISGVGETFIYKFDNVAPVNPVTVTVDPVGYTTDNSFDFNWNSGSDSGSGIAGYCYQYGDDAETLSEEICVSGLGVSGVPSYKSGENTFYLKAKDWAGNYAVAAQTVVYKHSGTAPSKPTNLRLSYPAEGNSNANNDFAFAWDPPDSYLGQQAGLTYLYSINEKPNRENVTTTAAGVTYLPRSQYATRKGTNTLYVVAVDEAGNVEMDERGYYLEYKTLDFVADTEAPGIPRNLDISDVSIKETNSWRLALSWDTPEASGSGIANYKVVRSSTSLDCESSAFEEVASTTSTSYVDTGLIQKKYNYCVQACDSTDECSAVSSLVSLMPDGKWRVPPSLVASPSAVMRTKSATISWSTNRTSNSFVRYGKGSGDYGEEVGSSDQVSSHEIELNGLDPGTTYFYKALWTDEDGNTGSSDELSMTTNPAPKVSTVKVSDVGMFSVYVNFTMSNANSAKIEYGKSLSYGGIEEVATGGGANSGYTVKLDNLGEGTVYHLRIVAEDEEGNQFVSDDYEFETLPVPKLSNVKIQQVKGASTATVRATWLSNTGTSSIVSFYPAGKPESVRDAVLMALGKKHEILIKDLADDSNYVFVIKGKDASGNNAEPQTVKFKTSVDLRPPVVMDLKIEAAVNGVGEEARAQIAVSWNTDENGSAQVEYGLGTGADYPNKTQDDGKMNQNHSVVLTDLQPASVYHLRVVSRDKSGNITNSYDNVVVTPKATKAALDLVVDNLSKSFSFFGGLGGVLK